MNPSILAQLDSYIKTSITEHYGNKTINIFDRVMEKCQFYYDRPAHSLAEIKDKMNTKLKGDIFEHFSYLYMIHVYGLSEVWLLKDIPLTHLTHLRLKRQDLGIDLIGKDNLNNWYAIQAKYRRPNKYKPKNILGWKMLSTFQAIVSNSGPWKKHIVITNADYIRHVGKGKGPKDKSICLKTLQNITPLEWERMAGLKGHILQEVNNSIGDADDNGDNGDDGDDGDDNGDDGDDGDDGGENGDDGGDDGGVEKNKEDKVIVQKVHVGKIRFKKPLVNNDRPDVDELRRRRMMFFDPK
jgi:hypothetical protein